MLSATKRNTYIIWDDLTKNEDCSTQLPSNVNKYC